MITGRDCDCEDFPCCGHGYDGEEEQRVAREYAEEDAREREDYYNGEND